MENESIFADNLIKEISTKKNPCIVGLDPNLHRMPQWFIKEFTEQEELKCEQASEIIYQYTTSIIEAVHDLVPAVKPQSAYFERYGASGIKSLERVITYAKRFGLLVILDAKRGDIKETSEAYAEAYLSSVQPRNMEVDCITLNPYLGPDSLQPFIDKCYSYGKGVFICDRTSNPGAVFLQNRKTDGKYVFELVAEMIRSWAKEQVGISGYSSIGAVVGATCNEEAKILRNSLPQSIFLVPGFGAQKGSLDIVKECFNSDGLGAIVNSSRAINYPNLETENRSQLIQAIRSKTLSFIKEVQSCLA